MGKQLCLETFKGRITVDKKILSIEATTGVWQTGPTDRTETGMNRLKIIGRKLNEEKIGGGL
jgi:hypothetical protein